MTVILFGQLSLMMLLQFATWGAWAPGLAAHLHDELGFSDRQTRWVSGAFWLACILSPLAVAHVADRWVAAERLLAAAHLVGGALLLACAWQRSFRGLLGLMLAYGLLYAPTLALVNSVMFRRLSDPMHEAGAIRVWGAVGWIIAGWAMALWRGSQGQAQRGHYRGFVLGGIFSLLMGVASFLLPHTPPTARHAAAWAGTAALGRTDTVVLLVLLLAVSTQADRPSIRTERFLSDLGVASRHMPGMMRLAQVGEILGMAVLLPLLLPRIGYKWALAIGALAWPARYVIFALMKPVWLVVSAVALQGLGYTFFIFAGQIYVDSVAPPDVRASAQALVIVATLGLGSFLGAQFTGVMMDFFKFEGRFRWRPIFLVPCILTIACAIAFLALFKG